MTKDQQPTTQSTNSKTQQGKVVSSKGDKTVVVSVDRFIKHPKYKKYYTRSKRYQAHDENNEYEVGDVVEIVETRPISKTKHHKVVGKIK